MNKNNLPPNVAPQTHGGVIHGYGLFMVTWSVLEAVIQAAVHKHLGVSAVKTVLVTGKLQFNPRVQLLISLLKLEGNVHKEAIQQLNKIEGYAKRNALVHGLIIVGVPGEFSFVKYEGGASARIRFTADELERHTLELTAKIDNLQQLLQVTDADTQAILDATLELASQAKSNASAL